MTQVANLSLFASCLHFILRTQKVQCTASPLNSLESWEQRDCLLPMRRTKWKVNVIAWQQQNTWKHKSEMSHEAHRRQKKIV